MSRSRKRLFTLSLILIPFFVLALVETGLRVFHYGEDTDLFISDFTDEILKQKPDDPVCLYNLSDGKPEQAWATARELERVKPSLKDLMRLKSKIRRHLGN